MYAISGTIDVATSLVDGGVLNSGGTITCVDDYNASFVALNPSCA